MPRFSVRFILTALAVGWAVDLLFWKSPVGINFFIWVLLLLAGLGFLLYSERVRPAWSNLALVLPILGLAAAVFIRREEMTVFIASMLALLGLMLLAAVTRTGNWSAYRLGDYVKAYALTAWYGLIGSSALLTKRPAPAPAPVDGASAEAAPAPRDGGFRRFARTAGPVLLGLALALPLLLILGGLLSSADPVFAGRLKDLLKIFDLAKLPEYIFRAFYVLTLAYVFTGVYAHAVLPARLEPRPNPLQPWMKPFLGHIEGTVVLLCVDALFAFFVLLQFSYFFNGSSNVTVDGYTFSEYAVRGFNELVSVAVISLLLYLGLSTISRHQSQVQRRVFSVLAVLLLGLVAVILVSAWYRLGLYEQAYGFTRLRTYTHIFIPWLGVLLLAAILLEAFGRRGHFALALLAVVVGFGLTFPILNVDRFIAQRNIARAAQGLELDADYLKQLSTDAVPLMLQQYAAPESSPAVKSVLGAELACRAATSAAAKPRPWTGFNLSESRAKKLLTENAPALSSFNVRHNVDSYPAWEVKLNGQWQDCQASSGMD